MLTERWNQSLTNQGPPGFGPILTRMGMSKTGHCVVLGCQPAEPATILRNLEHKVIHLKIAGIRLTILKNRKM